MYNCLIFNTLKMSLLNVLFWKQPFEKSGFWNVALTSKSLPTLALDEFLQVLKTLSTDATFAN